MSILRDLTEKIKENLTTDEILLIAGARQSGKTTLLKQIEEVLQFGRQNSYFLNLEDPEYLALLNDSPKNIFKIFSVDLMKKTFLLIDEVQYLNNPTNFLKYLYDEYKGKIKIIATGSSAFYLDRKFKDSLVGRKKIFYLYTLSFREFLRFKNEVELSLKDFRALSLSEKEKIILLYGEYLLYGGYPRVVLSSQEEKEDILKDIAYSYIKKDIFEANIRNEAVFYELFRILASQIGNLVNASELASMLGISRTAVEDYLEIMQKSFHLRLIPPFHRNIRKEISKMPKVYFFDLGLRNFLVKNLQPYSGREDKGPLLENALFRELLEKYVLEDIRFWRTTQKHEIDFVVGEKYAYEVKVNPGSYRKRRHEVFLEQYPQIQFSLVSFDVSKRLEADANVLEVWQTIPFSPESRNVR